MQPNLKQAEKRKGSTIVELLTVMCINVILIGLKVPALNRVRRFARDVQQKAQLKAMDAAVELFRNEFDGYPPSGALDPMGQAYCGSMKLCEALMGQDLLGFHTNSVFRRDGLDAAGKLPLYPPNIDAMTPALRESNLKARKGPFLPAENVPTSRLQDIYGSNIGPYLGTSFVICDVYARDMRSGQKTGMPILYFKADTANSYHDPNFVQAMNRTDSHGNIFNYWDNQDLVLLGKPWQPSGGSAGTAAAHKMADPARFYRDTQSTQITTTMRPFRVDTFILISAGWDNEYGTADDICNFEWRYRE